MWLGRKTRELPSADQVLPGRHRRLSLPDTHVVTGGRLDAPFPDGMALACFGMGCFWGAERKFWETPGVYSTAVGYAGGVTPNPTYEEVCSGLTGHAEVVRVVFDPQAVPYETLLRAFWENHDPTQGIRQGNDIGTQYRSAIYWYGEAQRGAAEASRDVYQRALTTAGYGRITTETREALVSIPSASAPIMSAPFTRKLSPSSTAMASAPELPPPASRPMTRTSTMAKSLTGPLAGSLRQLDPRVTASRPLEVFFYDILAAEGVGAKTQWEAHRLLRAWGLRMNELCRMASSLEDVVEYHRSLASRRDDLPYEIDGIVVKLNDLAQRKTVGSTSHHPRWAFALKFAPRKQVTRVLSIEPSVGRTGVVTPIGLLRPVQIGGVTVSRASLHNREEVSRKDIRAGDRVRVQRAGDVIPQMVQRVEQEDDDSRQRAPAFCRILLPFIL